MCSWVIDIETMKYPSLHFLEFWTTSFHYVQLKFHHLLIHWVRKISATVAMADLQILDIYFFSPDMKLWLGKWQGKWRRWTQTNLKKRTLNLLHVKAKRQRTMWVNKEIKENLRMKVRGKVKKALSQLLMTIITLLKSVFLSFMSAFLCLFHRILKG